MASLKNRADLAAFPSRGHATRLRRYLPPLTAAQLATLKWLPYESPGRCSPRMARPLVQAGLLEADPQTPDIYRVTHTGAEVVAAWKRAGWL